MREIGYDYIDTKNYSFDGLCRAIQAAGGRTAPEASALADDTARLIAVRGMRPGALLMWAESPAGAVRAIEETLYTSLSQSVFDIGTNALEGLKVSISLTGPAPEDADRGIPVALGIGWAQ